MPSVQTWARLMPHTVLVEKSLGEDGYGNRTFGPPVQYQARVQGRQRLVRTLGGDERVSMVTVYIMGTPGVQPDDRLTLPDGWIPLKPPILALGKVADEKGQHHEVVFC